MLSFPSKRKHCSKNFIGTIGEALVNWPYCCSALKKIRARMEVVILKFRLAQSESGLWKRGSGT